MIRWIQSRQWLPKVLVATVFFLVFGGFDLAVGSPGALIVTASMALAVFFAARVAPVSAIMMITATVLAWYLDTGLTIGMVGYLVAIYLSSSAPKLRPRLIVLVTSLGCLAALAVLFKPLSVDSNSQLSLAIDLWLTAATVFAVYLAGRLLITRVVHVGTSLDQKVAGREAAQLSLRLAEQEGRFQIAREIAEVILQDITAVLSQAEGGSYAAKLDPTVAIRVLERVAIDARSAHQELRRLYDQLNRNLALQAAPPSIDDLAAQIVLLREFGYSANLTHSGQRFEITEGASLAIYRLVFDALENVKDHVPSGSSVSVDFSWVGEGMQVLIKDNGIEVANRAAKTLAEAVGEPAESGYSPEDDLNALVKPIIGPSITAMRERAALYGGAVEVTKVPGVGFTVSAIFPQLRNLAGTNQDQ